MKRWTWFLWPFTFVEAIEANDNTKKKKFDWKALLTRIKFIEIKCKLFYRNFQFQCCAFSLFLFRVFRFPQNCIIKTTKRTILNNKFSRNRSDRLITRNNSCELSETSKQCITQTTFNSILGFMIGNRTRDECNSLDCNQLQNIFSEQQYHILQYIECKWFIISITEKHKIMHEYRLLRRVANIKSKYYYK